MNPRRPDSCSLGGAGIPRPRHFSLVTPSVCQHQHLPQLIPDILSIPDSSPLLTIAPVLNIIKRHHATSSEEAQVPISPTLAQLPPCDKITTYNMATTINPLLSTQKSSDGLQVALHPLPVLEISDYITRSIQRGYKAALVGALLGESKGREITIEHSFTCGVIPGRDGTWIIDEAQFATRLEQRKFLLVLTDTSTTLT